VALDKGYVPAGGERDPGRLADAIRQIHQNAAGQSAVDAVQALVDAIMAASIITSATTSALSAERVLTNTATVTWDFSVAGQAKATAASSGAQVKSGTFTRDTATASGTQAVTGVGFQPKCLMIVAGINGQASFGLGFDNGTAPFGAADDHVDAANTWVLTSSQSMIVAVTAGNNYQGKVSTMDSDGFTVSWTRVGAPTGTLTVGYLAIA
jgi:hypothetical protein